MKQNPFPDLMKSLSIYENIDFPSIFSHGFTFELRIHYNPNINLKLKQVGSKAFLLCWLNLRNRIPALRRHDCSRLFQIIQFPRVNLLKTRINWFENVPLLGTKIEIPSSSGFSVFSITPFSHNLFLFNL